MVETSLYDKPWFYISDQNLRLKNKEPRMCLIHNKESLMTALIKSNLLKLNTLNENPVYKTTITFNSNGTCKAAKHERTSRTNTDDIGRDSMYTYERREHQERQKSLTKRIT